MIKNEMEHMLKDGFSRKMAQYYLDILNAEKSNGIYDEKYMEWAHSKGFCAKNAMLYGLTDENCDEYLSDYDYYRIWPLNNWTRIWVNDKMTLKYMLSKTNLDSLMPYYYYYSPEGLRALIDNPYNNEFADANQFVKLLKEVGEFACKPCNGTASVGFFKMTYSNDKIYVDGEELKRENLEDFLKEYQNYVFTEFLRPGGILGEISPQIHTLRIVTINKDGYNPEIIGGYLRIPNNPSFSANYITLEEHQEEYNIFIDFNFESGEFFGAKKVFIDKVEDIDYHPYSKIKLQAFIENYDELKSMVLEVAKTFNNIEYMGFDIGVSENGFKCMEINTHPGIGYMQLFRPLLDNECAKNFYISKINKLNAMSDEQKKIKNSVLR